MPLWSPPLTILRRAKPGKTHYSGSPRSEKTHNCSRLEDFCQRPKPNKIWIKPDGNDQLSAVFPASRQGMATCAGGAYMLPATPHVCSTRHVDSSLLPCFQLWAPPPAFSDNRKVNLLFILEEETILEPLQKISRVTTF